MRRSERLTRKWGRKVVSPKRITVTIGDTEM